MTRRDWFGWLLALLIFLAVGAAKWGGMVMFWGLVVAFNGFALGFYLGTKDKADDHDNWTDTLYGA